MKARHTDEWVGLLVVLSVLLLIGAALQAGLVRDWFRPTTTLRILLPQSGVAGLAVGADVEVLGTRVGTIRRIIIDPRQQMAATAQIDDQAEDFIRRDSVAVIRRRFGVAGAAYVDIPRGTGAPLDWNFAVIDATSDRSPTDVITAALDEIRQKVLPILDDFGAGTHALSVTLQRAERGEGTVGVLFKDDTLAHDAQTAVHGANEAVQRLDHIMLQLDAAAHEVQALAQSAGNRQGVPALMRRADQVLAKLQDATANLAQASARTPSIARNIDAGTSDLPALLTQTQITAQQLEALLTQLRGLWLLGGGGADTPEVNRLPSAAVRP